MALAKTTRPVPAEAVPRRRLFRRLDRARRRPVTWVWGPPGAGKTTLVASYLTAVKLRHLWYQINSGDGDVATFFYYMGQAAPRRRRPMPLLTPEYRAGLPSFSRRYFRDLYRRLTPPFALVFDNYQDAPGTSDLHEVMAEAAADPSHPCPRPLHPAGADHPSSKSPGCGCSRRCQPPDHADRAWPATARLTAVLPLAHPSSLRHRRKGSRDRDLENMSLDGKDRDRQASSKHSKVFPVGRHDRRPVTARSQGNQRIVLEISALGRIPTARIAEHLDQPARLPPVRRARLPLHTRQLEQVLDQPLGLPGSRAAAKLRQHHRRVANHERSGHRGQRLLVESPLPVIDVDPAVQDCPGHVTWPGCCQASACPRSAS